MPQILLFLPTFEAGNADIFLACAVGGFIAILLMLWATKT